MVPSVRATEFRKNVDYSFYVLGSNFVFMGKHECLSLLSCNEQIKYYRYITLYPSDIPHYYDQQQGQAIFYLCRSVSSNIHLCLSANI